MVLLSKNAKITYNKDMKNLSVVMATFNEEKNLERCLSSVKDFADEIVIVDGTSGDKTIEIAKKFGAKIKVTTNKSNFHINKQMAIDLARGDWILQLDADEVVGSGLANEIKKIIRSSPEENGYWIPRKNHFLGRFLKKGGQYPDYTIRLYRNGKGRLPQKDVHEQAVVEGKVGYLNDAILHYPYFGFGHYLSKWDNYNNFYSNQIKEEQSKKNIVEKGFYSFLYMFVRPNHWFLTTYIRHKGFMDSWQGFLFSLFSALRFPVSYIKYIGFYKLAIIFIILFSFFLRFYNFDSRWGLAGDDGRDALIALEAIKRGELPLAGSFSSAGPFVFGGLFYWFIMLSYLIMPWAIWAPWFFTGLIGVLTVLIMIYIGKELGGKSMALIIGIFAATSAQLVARSLLMGQHTFISTFTALLILSVLLLWRTKNKIFAFFAGISLGLAISFHYQALNLLIFIPAILFIFSIKIKDRLIYFLLFFLGLLLPSLPMLYWDMQQNFANTNNLADYFLIGQYRVYVPNSWSLFIFDHIPAYWGFVVGKYSLFGLFAFLGSIFLVGYHLVKKRLPEKLLFLGLIFSILLFVNRYYRGDRSEAYLLYLLPFILIFTSWFVNQLIANKNKIIKMLGVVLFLSAITGSMFGSITSINYVSSYGSFKDVANKLYVKYPDKKFTMYDYKYEFYHLTMPMSLILAFDEKSDINGKKIGLSCIGVDCPQENLPVIIDTPIMIVDIEGVSAQELNKKEGWIQVNKENVYDDLIGWLHGNRLKSNFSLSDYIINKFNE